MMNAILMNQLQIIFGSYGFHSEHINHGRLSGLQRNAGCESKTLVHLEQR